MSRDVPTFVSLFSGCGGFDLGFLNAGYRCVAAFDADPIAVATHRRNLRSSAQVHDLSVSIPQIDRLRGIDVLVAGPPCQGFSTVGQRRLDDPRNSLLLVAAELANRIRPRVVIVENVAGVVSGAQRQYWDRLIGMLRIAGHGYKVVDFHCDATSFGVAQTRRRMVALAWSSCGSFEPELDARNGPALRDAIGKIGCMPDHRPTLLTAGSDLAKIAQHIRPGQKLCNVRGGIRSVHTWDVPEVFGPTTATERVLLEALLRLRRQCRIRSFGDADPVTVQSLRLHLGRPVEDTLRRLQEKGFIRRLSRRYDLVHTFNGKFRRLRWDRPAPTVDTRFGDPRYFLHPEEDRGFTVREAARIQGFPDWFAFEGSERVRHRLIGNAVPPPLARHLADQIRATLLP